MASSLETEVLQLHAEICAGLADPTRILILYSLSDGSHNVTEICDTLDKPQPSISRHLKILRERGMVATERQGASVRYELGDKRLVEALDLLRAALRDRLEHRSDLADLIS